MADADTNVFNSFSIDVWSGTFGEVWYGTLPTVVPDQPGVEWTLSENKAHWTLDSEYVHWTLDDSKAHWTIDKEE